MQEVEAELLAVTAVDFGRDTALVELPVAWESGIGWLDDEIHIESIHV